MPITDAEKQTILTSIHYYNELLKKADPDSFYSYEKNKIQLEDLQPSRGFGEDKIKLDFEQSTIYRVGTSDDYGRLDETLTFVRAHSRTHASIKGALKLNNAAIACSGYYTVSKTDQNEIDQIRNAAEYILQQTQNIK